jgi:16S rRNA processing protein RimM
VEVLTDAPERRFARGAVLHPEGTSDQLTISKAAADGQGWLLRFREIPDRTAAEALRDCYLEAEAIPAERDPDGSYYWHEVLGAQVKDPSGRLLGTVQDIYRAGGGEVYLVRGEPYGEFDLPAVRAVVLSFDPVGAGIVVDPAALGLEQRKERPRRADRRSPSRAPSADGPEVPGDG